MLNREYEILPGFRLEDLRDKVVIDAGAHVGLYSIVVSTYAKRVIAIEPHPVNYRLLEINIVRNNIRNIIPINAALVAQPITMATLCEGEHSGAASIIIHTQQAKCYNVNTITLQEILDKYVREEDNNVLKIDVEGAEYQIFENIDKSYLRRLDRIVGEIHLHYGKIDTIIRKLRDSGFEVRCFYPPLLRQVNSQIKLVIHGYIKLKFIRAVLYSLARLFNVKERNLMILYAWRLGK